MKCLLVLPMGQCTQDAEAGTSYCYYHNRVFNGLIEPVLEEAYIHPANVGFNIIREAVKQVTAPERLLALVEA